MPLRNGDTEEIFDAQSTWIADLSTSCSMSGSSSYAASSNSVSFRITGEGDQGYLFSAVGNHNYAAPEVVIGGGYGKGVDWWAVGILMFHFMSGTTPFAAETIESTSENIVTHRVNWKALPKSTSAKCKEFISALLAPDPLERMGDDTVLKHNYFDDVDFEHLYDKDGPYIPASKEEGDVFEEAKCGLEFQNSAFRGQNDSDADESLFNSFSYNNF